MTNRFAVALFSLASSAIVAACASANGSPHAADDDAVPSAPEGDASRASVVHSGRGGPVHVRQRRVRDDHLLVGRLGVRLVCGLPRGRCFARRRERSRRYAPTRRRERHRRWHWGDESARRRTARSSMAPSTARSARRSRRIFSSCTLRPAFRPSGSASRRRRARHRGRSSPLRRCRRSPTRFRATRPPSPAMGVFPATARRGARHLSGRHRRAPDDRRSLQRDVDLPRGPVDEHRGRLRSGRRARGSGPGGGHGGKRASRSSALTRSGRGNRRRVRRRGASGLGWTSSRSPRSPPALSSTPRRTSFRSPDVSPARWTRERRHLRRDRWRHRRAARHRAARYDPLGRWGARRAVRPSFERDRRDARTKPGAPRTQPRQAASFRS